MLLRVDQAPLYMREDSITTGYRKKLSYKACLSRYFFLFIFIFQYMYVPQHNIQSYLSLVSSIIKRIYYSWFWIHNETVNIWSHLIGFGIFVYCLILVIWSPPRQVNSIFELVPLIIQLLSYMVSTCNVQQTSYIESKEARILLG